MKLSPLPPIQHPARFEASRCVDLPDEGPLQLAHMAPPLQSQLAPVVLFHRAQPLFFGNRHTPSQPAGRMASSQGESQGGRLAGVHTRCEVCEASGATEDGRQLVTARACREW